VLAHNRYQDYNLVPFQLQLTQLSGLVHLRTLVLDKRPPFQQQLPAQQAAVAIPLTQPVLSHLARSWGQLQKLQLGLSRSDFGRQPLAGLAGFEQLRSLSVHCYDQGFDDGQYMLPLDVACLPSSLVKLDLMHAELTTQSGAGRGSTSSSGSSSSAGSSFCATHGAQHAGPDAHRACCSRPDARAKSNILRSASSSALATHGSCSKPNSSGGGSSSGSSRRRDQMLPRSKSTAAGTDASSSTTQSGTRGSGFAPAPAGAISSMLSESFSSMLSRQPSLDCSSSSGGGAAASALCNQQLAHQQQQAPAAAASAAAAPATLLVPQASGRSASAFAVSGAAAAAAAAAASADSSSSSSSSILVRCGGVPSAAAGAGACAGCLHTLERNEQPLLLHSNGSSASNSAGGGSSRLGRQMSLPPLPSRPSAVLRDAPARDVATARDQGGAELPCHMLAPQQQQLGAAGGSRQRANPFAGVAAAAAAQAAIDGCAAGGGSWSDGDSSTGSQSACAAADAGGGAEFHRAGLVRSQSMQQPAGGSGSGSGSGRGMAGGSGLAHATAPGCITVLGAEPGRAYLPLLQQLQLKHCCLAGIALDDLITKPIVSALWRPLASERVCLRCVCASGCVLLSPPAAPDTQGPSCGPLPPPPPPPH
jgi:hypothetical protein